MALASAAITVANSTPEKTDKPDKRKAEDGGHQSSSVAAGGSEKKPKVAKKVLVNSEAISDRIAQLDSLVDSRRYPRRKVRFLETYSGFLASLDPPVRFGDATPYNVRQFLVWSESFGKTKIHQDGCHLKVCLTSRGQDCSCPLGMAWGTLDSKVGMLRALYRDQGYGQSWDMHSRNPAASPEVKKHIRGCALEQTEAGVVVHQAISLFMDKILKLCRSMMYRAECLKISNEDKYLLMRDVTFLRVLCQTGDRANDLGSLLCSNIFWMLDREGFILKLVEGKTVSPSKPRYVDLYRSNIPDLCPISSIMGLHDSAKRLGIHRCSSLLFEIVAKKKGGLLRQHLSADSVNPRLKSHLEQAALYEGETIHGVRRGLAVMLAGCNTDNAEACRHLGWYSTSMYEHYVGRKMSVKEVISSGINTVDPTDRWAVLCSDKFRVFQG